MSEFFPHKFMQIYRTSSAGSGGQPKKDVRTHPREYVRGYGQLGWRKDTALLLIFPQDAVQVQFRLGNPVKVPDDSKYNSLALFGVEGNLQPFKWWTMKPGVTFMLQYAQTSRYTVRNQAMWKFSLRNNFTFSSTFGGTLYAYYEPESRMLDALWKPVAQINGSLYKTFLDDRLELRLDFTIWRHGRRTIIETPVYMQSVWNRTKETRAELTLTWNFSGGKKVNVRRNANSIQEYKQITDQR